jgi:hypothetical protein
MITTIKTFNGHTINDSNYAAMLLNPHGVATAAPVFLEQTNSDSLDAGAYTVDVQTKVLSITVRNYSNRYALIAQLKTWFKRGTKGDLVVSFADDDTTDYQISARVVNLVQDPEFPNVFTVILQTGTSEWRSVTLFTQATWTATGTTETQDIDIGGYDETILNVDITAAAAPTGGFLSQNIYRLPNTPGLSHGLIPWCITVNTAALIADASNKCQLNGGINNSVTTIAYDTVTGTLPAAGMGYVDTEQIKWTGKTGTTSGDLTGVTRGIGGTTAASHLDNAEIKVSHMLANCDDLRPVNMNTGQELKRWIASPNNASTKVWVNLDLAKGYSLTLLTSLSGVGVISEIKFVVNDTNIAAITELPKQGIVYHGNEWFAYSDTDPATCRLIVSQRGLFGTTVESHSAGVAFLYIQYPLLVKYGNSSATAPSLGDTTYDVDKPLIDLTNSSNTTWIWGGTGYPFFVWRVASPRTAAWTVTQSSLGINSLYRDTDTDKTTPAIWFRVKNYWTGGTAWLAENVEFAGTLYRAAGVTSITATGIKYRSNSNWLSTAGMRASLDGLSYTDLFTEAAPSAVSTRENWSNNSTPTSTPTGSKYVQVAFSGAYPGNSIAAAFADLILLTLSASFESSNVPSGAFLGAADNVPLAVTLENEKTGDVIYLNFNMGIGKVFSIDGENKDVLYDGHSAFGALSQDDEGRSIYLRLQGNATNTIRISAADLGQLDIDLSWYKRRL